MVGNYSWGIEHSSQSTHPVFPPFSLVYTFIFYNNLFYYLYLYFHHYNKISLVLLFNYSSYILCINTRFYIFRILFLIHLNLYIHHFLFDFFVIINLNSNLYSYFIYLLIITMSLIIIIIFIIYFNLIKNYYIIH